VEAEEAAGGAGDGAGDVRKGSGDGDVCGGEGEVDVVDAHEGVGTAGVDIAAVDGERLAWVESDFGGGGGADGGVFVDLSAA
jgi:hypothetical protein